MKNKIKTGLLAILIGGLGVFVSCADLLKVDSDSYLNTEDNRLDSPNDSVYSVVGILKMFRELGDRYFLLGELRGDLMAVTENADMNMQAIANFTATADNPYLSTREFYAVINNCNYFLQQVDTNIVAAGRKVMLGEYSVVKAIRAWTYMQLVLNCGKAVYLNEPILTIDDMNKDYPIMSPPQLIETLLTDMLDYIDEAIYPSYGGINRKLFVSGPMVAGELLLWMGAYTGNPAYYERAAEIYYRYIYDNRYLRGGGNYCNRYVDSNFEEILTAYAWNAIFYEDEEKISQILYSVNPSEVLNYPSIMRLTYPEITGNEIFQYMVKPSQAAMDLWGNETYTHYNQTTRELFYTKGDLRGLCNRGAYDPLGSYYYADQEGTLPCIAKFGYIIQLSGSYSFNNYMPEITLYRAGKMYLRYAEALNGLGKPSLAFAVLKYGLRNEILSDSTKINPDELDPLPAYCDFTNSRFSIDGGATPQSGMHTRGSGFADQDTLYYAFTEETLLVNSAYYGFPDHLASKQDSIRFVDAMICKELGLETAFEGNRFHDLMRFSIRSGGEEFLAKWVGRRDPALTTVLMNRDNWYLPVPD